MPWWFILGLPGIVLSFQIFDIVRAGRRHRREEKRDLEEAARAKLHQLLEYDADVQEGLREVDRMFPLHEPMAPTYSVALPPPEHVQEALAAQSQGPFAAQDQAFADQAFARAKLSALSNVAVASQWPAGLSNAAMMLDEDRALAQLRAAAPEASAKVFVESTVKNAVSKCQECERELRPSTWKFDRANHEIVFAWHCHRAETETRCDYMAFECGTEWSLRRAREALVPPVLFTRADQSPARRMDAEGLRVLAGGK